MRRQAGPVALDWEGQKQGRETVSGWGECTRVNQLKLSAKAHLSDTWTPFRFHTGLMLVLPGNKVTQVLQLLFSAEAWAQVSFEGVCVPMQVANIART